MAKAPTPKKAGSTKKGYRLIKRKKTGRYAVMKQGKLVHGADKVAILEAEGLIKKLKPKAKAAATEAE